MVEDDKISSFLFCFIFMDFVFYFMDQRPITLRAYSQLCTGITLCAAQGTIWGVEVGTWIGHMLGNSLIGSTLFDPRVSYFLWLNSRPVSTNATSPYLENKP